MREWGAARRARRGTGSRLGIRDGVRIDVYAAEPAPMGVAGPEVSGAVKQLLAAKGIPYHPEHQVTTVDAAAKRITLANGAIAEFDLLAYVPPHRPPRVVRDSGLVAESGCVSVDRHTLETRFPRVYAIGVGPVFDDVPDSDAGLARVRMSLLENPLFINRIVSPDATTTAVYVPIEPTANGKEIADKIRALLPSDSGDDRFYLAGDPVARDTFGTEMFRQMAVFSPIAGAVLCAVLWFMFRSTLLITANMAVAMTGIIWSMGLLIGLGYPVHIMSSMSPVFLMAIATDSVHIFNEFAFRFREVPDKRRAVLETMKAVGGPVFYSDVTTAAGFAALATATIVPVKIFGLVVAFGTLVILLMSFTLVPAILMLLREDRIATIARRTAGDDFGDGWWLARLGWFSIRRARAIAAIGAASLVVAGIGLSRIHVNNHMVHWFKSGSEVRTADRILNASLGGTSTAYLTVQGAAEDAIKDPNMLRGIEGVQRELEKNPLVGKTFSVVDYVKRVNRVLHADDAAFDRIPDSAEQVGQYLFLFGSSAKPSDLDNVVDYPFQKANIFVQLKSWDADVMEDVIHRTNAYLGSHPLPGAAAIQPAGIAYFNLIWSDEVLWGMLESFLAGIALVLLLLVVQTRSLLWGILACLPLALYHRPYLRGRRARGKGLRHAGRRALDPLAGTGHRFRDSLRGALPPAVSSGPSP